MSHWFCLSSNLLNPQDSCHLLPCRAPQRRDAGSWPWNGGKTEGSFNRIHAALVIGASRRKFAFGSLIEVAGQHHRTELETQVAYQKKDSDTNRSAFGALVVDVYVCNSEVLACLVRRSATCHGP